MATPALDGQEQNVRVLNRESFRGVQVDGGPCGGVLLPAERAVRVGQNVDLRVSFTEEGLSFRIRGIVRWRRIKAHRGAPAGWGVEFLASENSNLLLQFIRGMPVRFPNRSKRFSVAMECLCSNWTASGRGVTENMSRTGAFIRLRSSPPVNSRLQLKLLAPDGPIAVESEVVWSRKQGEEVGLGVQFVFNQANTGRSNAQLRIERLVGRIERTSLPQH